ncbi:MAG TPA: hypothetical protein VJR04_11910 [Terriglobales bacterium]|nr:hypothetical protein [Terriglobales bacterium]
MDQTWKYAGSKLNSIPNPVYLEIIFPDPEVFDYVAGCNQSKAGAA